MAVRNTPESFQQPQEKRGSLKWEGLKLDTNRKEIPERKKHQKEKEHPEGKKTSRRKKNHPEGKPVLNSQGKGYQSFPCPLWFSGHPFRQCSPTSPGGCAVTNLTGISVKSDPHFDQRQPSVIFEVDANQKTSTQAVPARTREAAGIPSHNYTQIPLNHI